MLYIDMYIVLWEILRIGLGIFYILLVCLDFSIFVCNVKFYFGFVIYISLYCGFVFISIFKNEE